MKSRKYFLRYFVIIIFLSFTSSLCFSATLVRHQDRTIQSDSVAVDNLALLCKVWGFLKYYHPQVTEGNFDWDLELIKVMPFVAASKSNAERNLILKNWIEDLGKVQSTQNHTSLKSKDIMLHPDLDWTNDSSILGGDIVSLLSEIKNATRKDSTYYIGFDVEEGNTIFKNENAYSDMIYPNVDYRLLSLFRYWNIIQYYFPYKYLIDDDWHAVLLDFIPQFVDASNELEYNLALLKLIVKVGDTHASLYTPIIEEYIGNRAAPYEIRFVENRAVVTALHKPVNNENNIKIGDVILSINGELVDSIILRKLEYTTGSNYPTQLRNIAYDLLRTNADKLFIEYKRGSAVFSDSIFCPKMKDLTMRNTLQDNKPLVETLDGNITYLYLGSAEGGTVPSNIDSKGLIIDLRCFPSYRKVKGYFDYEYLYPETLEFAKLSFSETSNAGTFTFRGIEKVGIENPNYYKGKIIILVDEQSQSHAEFTAMKYRCIPNAVVVGSVTAAADGDVSYFTLPGGIETRITALGVYYPDGTETQRVGIVPDFEVKPTIKGVREGRDEVLEKAIELINSK